MRNPLVTEADSEDGNRRLLDDFGTDAEVFRPLGCSWPRRNDDIVELVEHTHIELGPVVGHESRSAPVDLGEEVEEVEGERIGIVDEQRPDHARPSHVAII